MKNPTGCSQCNCTAYDQKVVNGTPTATCVCGHGEGQHTGNNA